MRWNGFPARISELEPFSSRFEARRLPAAGCDVLFARYPAGTEIAPHRHDTDNWGVVTKGEMILTVEGVRQAYGCGEWYHVPANAEHWASCAVDTEQIEFWFAPEGAKAGGRPAVAAE